MAFHQGEKIFFHTKKRPKSHDDNKIIIFLLRASNKISLLQTSGEVTIKMAGYQKPYPFQENLVGNLRYPVTPTLLAYFLAHMHFFSHGIKYRLFTPRRWLAFNKVIRLKNLWVVSLLLRLKRPTNKVFCCRLRWRRAPVVKSTKRAGYPKTLSVSRKLSR